jgi:phage terminase large subunit-like protein
MNTTQLDQPTLAPGEPLPPDLWTTLDIRPHPVCPLPDADWLRANPLEALLDYLNTREETIHAMAADPYRHGHEPHLWRILDALCGFPWADPEWALTVRQKLLRQPEPIKVLLLNGGNRGGKSEWASSRVIKLLHAGPRRRAWCFHQDSTMSIEYQQPLLYKYLPAELRTEKGIKRNPTYISYKQQTGFSEGRFVLPNGSDNSFRNYQQDADKIQGGELDVVWCDELVPATWVKELRARVATRAGWLLITFTPVAGYTATVKEFLDKAQKLLETTAYVLPEDGGPPDLTLALAAEDPTAWLENRPAQPALPPGRRFARVPRLLKLPDKRSGVFYFHSFDNPFGNPRELWHLYSAEGSEAKKMRFYGVATKQVSGQFPKFNPLIHVLPPDKIPTTGTNYHIVDPCSGRNWAQIWARIDRAPIGTRIWIYREWPCPGKYVPGIGDMGEWAIPGDKLDGQRGPAQRTLGWGHERYKREIYRLEGRPDWEKPTDEIAPEPFKFDRWDTPDPTPNTAAALHTLNRRRQTTPGEHIYERIMDSRYGQTPTQTREGQTTLLEECAHIGLDFIPASGRDIHEGTHLINQYLDYDPEQPISTLNSPRLYIAEDCANTIFALQNWTGEDGGEGACKDFVDLLRYLVLHDPQDHSPATAG